MTTNRWVCYHVVVRLKRKQIVQRIDGQIQAIDRIIRSHEQDRKSALKQNDVAGAGYHWGRISGLVDAIRELKIAKDLL